MEMDDTHFTNTWTLLAAATARALELQIDEQENEHGHRDSEAEETNEQGSEEQRANVDESLNYRPASCP